MPADVLFQAAAVPAGAHRVTLSYQPASATDGAIVSALAVAVIAALLAVRVWRWRTR